ncbi:ATP-binding cassette domain-containing protein [Novosphingobium sp. ZN18A2]|uniref:molybdenum ABC transporter ATP-binding protein n=1 Tax=Novosphingobium sp. ZN18A2 TaxID=3079861 RepID=UPI0030D0D6DD
MSFDVDVRVQLGGQLLGARFATDEGLTLLFGPSGAGKTTILNMVAGLVPPDAGHVRVGSDTLFDSAAGVNVPAHRRRLGFVFQDARLFPHMKVRANLLYGWKLARAEDRWIALEDVTAFLGIGALLDRQPRTLSGGEAQRVAIGRALLSGARALLMDEPLASLDPDRSAEIMRVIERVRDELKLPILYVTHDREEAARLATHRIEVHPLQP